MKKLIVSLFTILVVTSGIATAQTRKGLKLVEVFDAGQPQTIILKLYDDKADVLCYVLMPELASRKEVNSNWIYDANTIGSISCLKQQAVAPAADIKTETALPQSLKSSATDSVSSPHTETKPQAVSAKSVKNDTKASSSAGESKRPDSAASRAAAAKLDSCGQENTRKARQCRLKAKKKSQ